MNVVLEQLYLISISPIWSKLFVNILLLIYYLYVKSKKSIPELKIFLFISIILFVKDILSYYLSFEVFQIFSDILIISFYLIWIRIITDRKNLYNIFIILNTVFIIFSIINRALGIVPIDLTFYYRLFIIADTLYLAKHLYSVSEYNTEHPELIIQYRKPLLILLFVYNAYLLLFNEEVLILNSFILPLSYFIHIYMLNAHDKLITFEKVERVQYLSRDFEALYDFMKNIGDAIAENLEIENVLDYIVKSTVTITNSDAGVILIKDEYDDLLKVKAVFGTFPPPYEVNYSVKVRTSTLMEFFRSTPIKLGDTVLGEVGKTGKPIFIRNSYNDERLKYNTKNDICYIGSLIVVPLIIKDKIIGVISIMRKDSGKPFSESDFTHIKTFADYTSISLNNLFVYMELLEKRDMERDLGIAANIQGKLLPEKIPLLKNMDISAFSLAAKGVSGDYYDVFLLKNGKLAVIICDVAGKGVPASLVMVMIRTILHLIAGSAHDAARIISWINKGIFNQIELGHYATLSFLTYDPKTHYIEYSNAGHHPLLLYRKSTNKLVKIDTPGIPIGVEGASKYQQKRFKVEKDDLILLYTDGIIEAWNEKKEEYGIESIVKLIKGKTELSPEELSKEIIDDINQFVGRAGQHDDQTLLILKAK
jgi:phosphoserine phosphatase RsbU/P